MSFWKSDSSIRRASLTIDLLMLGGIVAVFILGYFQFFVELSRSRQLDQERLITGINTVIDDYARKEAALIETAIPLITSNSPVLENQFFTQSLRYVESLYSVNDQMRIEKIFQAAQHGSYLAGLDISTYRIAPGIKSSMETGAPVITPVHSSIFTGKQTIGFIFPALPRVIVAEINIQALFDLIGQAGLLNLYADSIVLLVSPATNQVLYSSTKEKYPFADLIDEENLPSFGSREKYRYNRQRLGQLEIDLVVLTPESFYSQSLKVIQGPFMLLITLVILFYIIRTKWIRQSVHRPLFTFIEQIKNNPRNPVSIGSRHLEFRSVESAYNDAVKTIDLTLKALRKEEERYRSLVDNIDLGVSLISADRTILMTNPRQIKMLDPPGQDIIGQSCHRVFENRDTICPHCPGTIALAQGKSTEVEIEKRMPNGEIRTSLLKAFPIFDENGGTCTFIEIAEDISEKKQLESHLARAQRMEAIGTLAGGVAHDFNNLLMGIQGYNSLLMLSGNLSPMELEHLKSIEEYVASASKLTGQLLGFARGGKYEVKPTDLNALIHRQCELFGRTRKEITIHERYAPDLRAVAVDQGQIEQVFLNLLVNAWHAMPGGGELFVETANTLLEEDDARLLGAAPGPYARISVTDTGIGMDEKTRQRLFDPFFTTKQMGRGSGLGLATVYGIVKNHGGFITVESEPEKGSTFTLYFPATEMQSAPLGNTQKKIKPGKESILFIDDEPHVADIGRQMLEKLGYSVTVSINPIEAIELYKKNSAQIDVVLLDMIMPGMSGQVVYDALKSFNPDIRVILSSGYSLDSQTADILQRGCNGFIQKPYGLADLSQKLREILDR